jgi:hypothetical protein
MSLPKIQVPIFELILPSTGKGIKYRPFLVKEQKILLMASESEDQKEMLRAIKQIVNNCAVDEVDVEQMPVFDLEYFFTRLRAKSVSEEIDLNLSHPTGYNTKGESCNHITNMKLNLLQVEVEKQISHIDKIILDEKTGIGVKLKYPIGKFIADGIENIENKNQIEIAAEALIACVDFIFDKDNIYKKEDSTKEELLEFFDNLSQDQFKKLSDFFETMPKLKHTIKWKCSGCGCDDEITLEGLSNFFAFA